MTENRKQRHSWAANRFQIGGGLAMAAAIVAALFSSPSINAKVRTEGIVLHTDAKPREIVGLFRNDEAPANWVPGLKESERDWADDTNSKDEWQIRRAYIKRLVYTRSSVQREGQTIRVEMNNMRRWKREKTKTQIAKASACFRAKKIPTGDFAGKTRLAFRVEAELNIPKWMGGKKLENRMVRKFADKLGEKLASKLDEEKKPGKFSGEIPKGKKSDASPLCDQL